jgi:phosphoserine phosphatase
MDGVLVRDPSSWGYVHQRLGTDNDDSLMRYLAGELDDMEFIRSDVALWREAHPGITLETIESILGEIPLMDGFRETMDALEERGIRRAMISGGLLPLASRLGEDGGIDPVLANSVVAGPGGELTGEGVVNVLVRRKGGHVPDIIRALGLEDAPGKVVAVGDSQVDTHMFRVCDLGIAFNPLDERVRRDAGAVVEGEDLRGILPHIIDD